ncbi:MAG: T9SS type A sorting domain-containing protein [bacterium]
MKKIVLTLFVCCVVMAYAGIADGDIVVPNQTMSTQTIEIPADFDAQAATAEMKAARKNGNHELAAELHQQISLWWFQNHTVEMQPMEQGSNDQNRKMWEPNEDHSTEPGAAPLWGNDVQVDSRTNTKPARVAALSNGHLYAIAVHYSGSLYYGTVRRSTNNGATWSDYWNSGFASTTTIFDPGIMVINDTLVYWYILDHPASNEMRTWFKVCLPGATDNPIYYGSPSGGFNPLDYSKLNLTTDAPNYSGEYLYATWTENYGTGPDSTRVMAAVSYEIDVSAWEVGPTRVRASSGANIYYAGTRIAWGSSTADMLWLVAYLHPAAYPQTFDRGVRGWWSDDYGSTWNGPVDITPYDNGRDEYDPAIAGGHGNTNWSVLAVENDTSFSSDRDVVNWYSTNDGTNWIDSNAWITNSYENYVPDIWVDVNSTGFYGVCRQDRTTEEDVRYKFCPIGDPNNWTGSTSVLDDPTLDLSGVYGASVGYNPGNGDAICAWTAYHGAQYSIWFSSESWTGIEEISDNQSAMGVVNLAPNPSHGSARLSFVVMNEGLVKVSVFDATGRVVDNLVNEVKPAGEYSLNINSADLASGVYFVQIETPEGTAGKTMTIIR